MINQLELFYLQQPEPNQSYMLALRQYILDSNNDFHEEWKWKIPFFYYKKKPFCYIWKNAKTQQPYLGIVKADLFDHPLLVKGKRKKMKIVPLDNTKNIPIKSIMEVFKLAQSFY